MYQEVEHGMNFTTFSTANTNIFPHANSKYGGQLMSEFNLRSREMTAVNPSIKFECGPSFVHCEDDFKLSATTSKITLAPGRGVINGHYIETLTPMEIDLMEANILARSQQKPALKGVLDIGFKVFYSTEPTMAGTMLVTRSTGQNSENSDDDFTQEVYLGIQTVILPADQFITPLDVSRHQNDIGKITAHIRLGRFSYYNGAVELSEEANKTIYTNKQRYISALRITDIESIVTDGFIRSDGLQPNQFYAFSGKTNNWCDATDSLMIWHDSETLLRRNGVNISPRVAEMDNGKVALQVFRKPVDSQEKAESIKIVFPNADYSTGTAGMVNKQYTDSIKAIASKFNEVHQLVGGKQVAYIDVKDSETKLPTINTHAWSVGDYILVNQDYTVDVTNDGVRAPSSMYFILPGQVMNLDYQKIDPVTVEYTVDLSGKVISGSQEDVLPDNLTGTELRVVEQLQGNRDTDPAGLTAEQKLALFDIPDDTFLRGTPGKDYVMCKYIFEPVTNKDESEKVVSTTYKYIKYYWVISESKKVQYSDAVLLTGQMPLAQENVIGGFYNVPSDTLDGGYIYRDDNGYLRLLDYGLLRTGVLAYQLGENYATDSSATAEQIQADLDEYVNQRVAFPSVYATDSNVITIDLNLTREDEPVELNIYDIDSRFNTSVLININGDADENTTINIVNCEKVRIGNNISGTPIINVKKCNLYYDSVVIDTIRQNRSLSNPSFHGFSDVKLWYERFEDEDPNIVIDKMTVMELDAPISSSIIDYWSVQTPNDNHYAYALKSITFNGALEIIRCELLVSNDSTANTEERHAIIQHRFELPQGQGLTYPVSAVTRPIKVTGTFVAAYLPEGGEEWIITDTNFSALSGVFDEFSGKLGTGSITFHAYTKPIMCNVTDIPEWEAGKYHIFAGGVIS